jgi:hypothetical protein
MLKTNFINTKVMKYKERYSENRNPPPAMRKVVRSLRQLDVLVRLRFADLFLKKYFCEQTLTREQRPTVFVGGCRLSRLCAKWVSPPF